MCIRDRVYIVAGVNKVCPDVEKAFWRARNVAAPLNARRFGKDTPLSLIHIWEPQHGRPGPTNRGGCVICITKNFG